MMNIKKIPRLFWILIVIGLTIIYALTQKKLYISDLEKNSNQHQIKELPQFSIFSFPNNKEITKKNLFENRNQIIVIHFWGTWCGPCEEEFPALLKFAKAFESNRQIKFLLVAIQDSPKEVNKFLQKLPYVPSNIQIAIDETSDSMNQFGTVKVPETFIVSNDEKILEKLVGPQDWNNPYYFERLNKLLKK